MVIRTGIEYPINNIEVTVSKRQIVFQFMEKQLGGGAKLDAMQSVRKLQ